LPIVGQRADTLAYDRQRTDFLSRNGYRVARYSNDDILGRTDEVLGDILRQLEP